MRPRLTGNREAPCRSGAKSRQEGQEAPGHRNVYALKLRGLYQITFWRRWGRPVCGSELAASVDRSFVTSLLWHGAGNEIELALCDLTAVAKYGK